MQAIGFVGARLYSLIFVEDGANVRATSLRKATRDEQDRYEENQ